MFSITDILLVTTVLFFVYWYVTRSFNYWKKRNVPYEKPLLFFGNLLDLVIKNNSTGRNVARLYNKFPDPYFGIFAMHTPMLVVKDPEIIKRILVRDFQYFPNRIFYNNEEVDPIVSNALFALKHPTSKSLRAKITPVFSTGKVKMTTPLMLECAENMITYLKSRVNESVETKDLATKYTIDVISSFAFGIDVNSFKNEKSEFTVAARKLFKKTFSRSIQPLAYIFAHKLVQLMNLQFFEVEAVRFLRNVFNETIQERERSGVKRNDLIDIILDIQNGETKEDEYKFYGDRLIAQAIMFFYAGHETSSSTITFTLYELAMNRDIQDRLRKEIKETIVLYGGITYDAVQNMKYLHMVVSETLRKYPLTPFLQRECVQDYLIPETGLVIEEGMSILIPKHAIHSDQRYFPQPAKYDPERFSSDNKNNINPYCYLAFGTGPRNCIGERFALLNVKLAVLNILLNFTVEPNKFTAIPLVFTRAFLLQAAGGVHLTYKNL